MQEGILPLWYGWCQASSYSRSESHIPSLKGQNSSHPKAEECEMYAQAYIESECSSEGRSLWIQLFSSCHDHRISIASTCPYNASYFCGSAGSIRGPVCRSSIHYRLRQFSKLLGHQSSTRSSGEACHQRWQMEGLPILLHWLPQLQWPMSGSLAVLSLVCPSCLMLWSL